MITFILNVRKKITKFILKPQRISKGAKWAAKIIFQRTLVLTQKKRIFWRRKLNSLLKNFSFEFQIQIFAPKFYFFFLCKKIGLNMTAKNFYGLFYPIGSIFPYNTIYN